MYVRCINNKQYLKQPDFEDDKIIPDLVIGQIYKVIPDKQEEALGYFRIVDESGEDYTFPATYFETIDYSYPHGKELDSQITIHLSELDKAILRAEALAAQTSVSALIREWIEERLDLPQAA
jgi:hypothetical protein